MPKKGNVPWNKGKRGVQVCPMKGKHHTDATKEKMRLKKLGKPGNHKTPHTAESIALMKKNRSGIPAWNKGLEMPESFCKTMSRVQEGKITPIATRLRLSNALKDKAKTEIHVQNVVEAFLKLKTGEGFWYGNVKYDPPRLQYCERWKDVNPRVHAFFNYECCECHAPENGKSHIGHHVFYVKEACCWYSDEGVYFSNLNAPGHPENDYCIGENPNYFVILCPRCHGKTNGNFENRKKWADHFKEMIDTKFGGKCYFTKEEMAGKFPPG